MPIEKTPVTGKDEPRRKAPEAKRVEGNWSHLSDEQRILKALRVPPPNTRRPLAPFKIEIHWGQGRTVLGPNKGCILIWESGKRFHGGGDEMMYWCGYDDCRQPIRTQFFTQFHVVCPHCTRECHLDQETKKSFAQTKGLSSTKRKEVAAMPLVFSEKLFFATTRKVADEVERIFRSLASSADIYMKFHPTDIRYAPEHGPGHLKNIDHYQKVRQKRPPPSIYPLARLMKDLAAGADLRGRIFAFFTS